MRIAFRFTQSARKHRIGRAHVKAAMGNAVLVEIRKGRTWRHGDVHRDDRDIELEIGIKGRRRHVGRAACGLAVHPCHALSISGVGGCAP